MSKRSSKPTKCKRYSPVGNSLKHDYSCHVASTTENLLAFIPKVSGNRGLWWCIKLDPNYTKLDWLSNQNQTRRTTCEGTVPLPPWGCYQNNDITVVLSVWDITKSVVREKSKGAGQRWKEGCIDRDSSSFRETQGIREWKPQAVFWLNSPWTAADLFSPEPVARSKGAYLHASPLGCCGAGLGERRMG